MKVRVIAEVGENHLGDMNRALEMVRTAAASGADFVKFQSYESGDLLPGVTAEARNWIQRVQLSEGDHHVLRDEADRRGITFLSTALSVRWAALLRDMGCRVVKIASLSLVNRPLLEYVGAHFEEVFLSTGMGDLGEIETALQTVGSRARVTLLHCVSRYPTPDRDASLLTVPFLKKQFDVPIGYSDHTIGTVACMAACALGAELIEKHFTLDKTLEGTDHILSADPAELAEITHGCRRVAMMLGEYGKQLTEGEQASRASMRHLFREA